MPRLAGPLAEHTNRLLDERGADTPSEDDAHDHDSGHGAIAPSELIRIALILFVATLLWFRVWDGFGHQRLVGLTATLAGGYPIFKEAFDNMRQRRMTMELSMTIALVAALAIGEEVYFAAGAAAVTFLVTHDVRSTISVIIVAGACGVAAGTPLAILGAIGRAARAGAIIKGGLHLEALWGIDTVVLDKTGTVTFGDARVRATYPVSGGSARQLLEAAGFSELPATTAEQDAKLKTLPALKLGYYDDQNALRHYWLADPDFCKCLFHGDAASYQRFENIKLENQVAERDRRAVEMQQQQMMGPGLGPPGFGPPGIGFGGGGGGFGFGGGGIGFSF